MLTIEFPMRKAVTRSAVLGKCFRDKIRKLPAPGSWSYNFLNGITKALKFQPHKVGKRRKSERTPIAVLDPASHCTLLDLTNTTCRWPIGDPGNPDFRFCGTLDANLSEGHPYCANHSQIAYHVHR